MLRREGRLDNKRIADMTRWMRKPTTHNGVEDILEAAAKMYRKALWTDADTYVEVWCEKDALAGVILPVTAKYDVPLMVSRGFASETSVTRPSPPPTTIAPITFTISATLTARDKMRLGLSKKS
jgi:hypothetical protein